MSKGPNLTEAEIAEIFRLHHEGMPTEEIAIAIGRSYMGVKNCLYRRKLHPNKPIRRYGRIPVEVALTAPYQEWRKEFRENHPVPHPHVIESDFIKAPTKARLMAGK